MIHVYMDFLAILFRHTQDTDDAIISFSSGLYSCVPFEKKKLLKSGSVSVTFFRKFFFSTH